MARQVFLTDTKSTPLDSIKRNRPGVRIDCQEVLPMILGSVSNL